MLDHVAGVVRHSAGQRIRLGLTSRVVQDGCTACMMAAQGGHEAVVRLLLQSGAEVNATAEVMRRLRASQTLQRPWLGHPLGLNLRPK